MEPIIEKIFIAAIGGFVAYFFAYRRFILQRWWEKRFDLYCEAINILKQISHSLAIYEWALENGQTIENSKTVNDAYLEFEDGLSQLNGLQNKMLLIGLDKAHVKLLPLAAALKIIHPSYLTSKASIETAEILDLVKQSKQMTQGCSGELAFQGRDILKGEFLLVKKFIKYVNILKKFVSN